MSIGMAPNLAGGLLVAPLGAGCQGAVSSFDQSRDNDYGGTQQPLGAPPPTCGGGSGGNCGCPGGGAGGEIPGNLLDYALGSAGSYPGGAASLTGNALCNGQSGIEPPPPPGPGSPNFHNIFVNGGSSSLGGVLVTCQETGVSLISSCASSATGPFYHVLWGIKHYTAPGGTYVHCSDGRPYQANSGVAQGPIPGGTGIGMGM